MSGTGEAPHPRNATERVGSLLGARYRLVRKLGEGGMGVVYEAEHIRLKQRFAVKLLGRSLATGSFVARFEREARAAAQLTSRHVAKVFDVDTAEDGSPFFAMELLQGRDLHAEIDLRGRLPWAEAARVVQEACAGMTDAHERGIIHRDLKPANLFLHRQDGGRIVKVLDFGISKNESDDIALTQTQQALGTPLYMSPEQIRSPKNVDARTDVWSLGVILYESLTGRAPFFAETVTGIAVAITNDVPPDVSSVCEEVPAELSAVVRRAMSKSVAERFGSAREFGAALAPFAGPELGDVLPGAPSRDLSEALESTVSADVAGYGSPSTAVMPLVVAAPKSRARLVVGAACAVGVAVGVWAFAFRGERTAPAVFAGAPTASAFVAIVTPPIPSSSAAPSASEADHVDTTSAAASASASASASSSAASAKAPTRGGAPSASPPATTSNPPPPKPSNAATPPAFL